MPRNCAYSQLWISWLWLVMSLLIYNNNNNNNKFIFQVISNKEWRYQNNTSTNCCSLHPYYYTSPCRNKYSMITFTSFCGIDSAFLWANFSNLANLAFTLQYLSWAWPTFKQKSCGHCQKRGQSYFFIKM